jgi:integrase
MARKRGQARDRILTDPEISAVWRASEGLGVRGAFIRFLLLTGCRRNEAAQAEWTEISDGIWTLPASRSKTKSEVSRPLSAAALATLPAKTSRFVFSWNGDVGLTSFTKLKAQLDAASKTSDWRIHDLRRTSRSLMSRAGIATELAERMLGHAVPTIQKVYDRHKYLEEMSLAYSKLADCWIELFLQNPAWLSRCHTNLISLRNGRCFHMSPIFPNF